MNYERIRNHPNQFLALTGLYIEEFDSLAEEFDYQWNKHNKRHLYNGKLRKNKPSKKGKGKLPTADHKLFFILYYYKNNPIQEALAASFSMDQPQANKWISKIERLLHSALKAKNYLPTRTPEQLYDLLIEKGEQHLLLDATERPINRSVDDDIQREQYSGKKKIMQ